MHRFFTTWICLFILHVEVQVLAQQTAIRTYTVSDGLVMNRVNGFYQDASGFMWICTWDGLSRYEGNRFRNYISGRDLTHGIVNDIVEYPDGSMYVALNDGTIEVIRDLEVQPEERTKGLPINAFFRDYAGRVYGARDYAGICAFDKGVATPFLLANADFIIHEAVAVSDDVFLFISRDHKPSGVMNTQMQFLKSWTGHDFECIYRDNEHRILLGTDTGLKEVNMNEGSEDMYSLHDPDFIPEDAPWKSWSVITMIQDNDGNYWIATVNGLIRMRRDKSWTLFTKQDGLPSNLISSLFIDNSNTLWMGTYVGAASLNLSNTISQFDIPNNQRINYFLPQPGGYMYCLSENRNVFGIDPSGKVISEPFVSIGSDPPSNMIDWNGDALLLVKSGVEILPPLSQDEGVSSVTSTFSRFAVECKHHIYFVSTGGLLYCSDGRSSSPATGLRDSSPHAIVPYEKDKLLLGYWSDGLFLASAPDSMQPCDLHIDKDLSRWLPNKDIRSLMVSANKDIWIGTRHNGLARLRCDAACDSCEMKAYRMADGLMSNWITCMAEDSYGNLWIGSTSGIDKLTPDKDDYRIFSYSRVFDFNGHAVHLAISSDQSIWCATSEGYARIMDGRQDTMAPLQAHITEANMGGIRRPNHNRSEVVLPYNNNSVNFTFAAPDYISTKHLAFTYRLLGSQDTLWSSSDHHQQIFYSNLLPGSYVFEVSAIGLNGERGKSVDYAFKITPPFWQRLWFVCLVLFAITACLYALHRFRIAQIERTQKVRDRIASDLHDEIGSTLTHVNILSEFGKQTVDEKGKPADIFEKIGSEMQASSEALDDIIWSVKNRRDSIEDVVARMRKYSTELLEPAGIRYIISEESSPDQQLDMELRRDLYLAFKELLRNIVRHAGATDVDIHIHIDRRIVKLLIRDNGKGFDVQALTQRNGLKNIRKRVQRWHGKADWTSTPALGTEVFIEMKLP